jgi:hypothetical protein
MNYILSTGVIMQIQARYSQTPLEVTRLTLAREAHETHLIMGDALLLQSPLEERGFPLGIQEQFSQNPPHHAIHSDFTQGLNLGGRGATEPENGTFIYDPLFWENKDQEPGGWGKEGFILQENHALYQEVQTVLPGESLSNALPSEPIFDLTKEDPNLETLADVSPDSFFNALGKAPSAALMASDSVSLEKIFSHHVESLSMYDSKFLKDGQDTFSLFDPAGKFFSGFKPFGGDVLFDDIGNGRLDDNRSSQSFDRELLALQPDNFFLLNDAPIAFDPHIFFFNVDENSPDIKIADILIIDDGVGQNILGLTGTHASMFEIRNAQGDTGELWFVGGGDFETDPILDVTVTVNDPTVGGAVDAFFNFQLILNDVVG